MVVKYGGLTLRYLAQTRNISGIFAVLLVKTKVNITFWYCDKVYLLQ